MKLRYLGLAALFLALTAWTTHAAPLPPSLMPLKYRIVYEAVMDVDPLLPDQLEVLEEEQVLDEIIRITALHIEEPRAALRKLQFQIRELGDSDVTTMFQALYDDGFLARMFQITRDFLDEAREQGDYPLEDVDAGDPFAE